MVGGLWFGDRSLARMCLVGPPFLCSGGTPVWVPVYGHLLFGRGETRKVPRSTTGRR
jgi:hypothetical protein